MKKLLLSFLMLLMLVVPASADVILPDNLTVIEEDAFAGNTNLKGKLVIPEGVTTIGSSAFSGCTGLTGLELPDSVTVIGDSAFSGCTSLKATVSADGCEIAENAFDGCAGVKITTPVSEFQYSISGGEVTITAYQGSGADVVIPETIEGLPVTAIGFNAFASKGMKTVTLPGSIRTLDRQAFVSCEKLTSVYGAENVVSYGTGAFHACTKLSHISIGSRVVEMQQNVFLDCLSLPDITLCYPDDSPLNDIDTFNYGPAVSMYFFSVKNGEATLTAASNGGGRSDAWHVSIPSTYMGVPVTSIGERVFYGNNRVSGLTLPKSIRSIGAYAFANCSSLKATVYTSGRSIGEGAFSGCSGVTLVNKTQPDATPTPAPTAVPTPMPTATPQPTPDLPETSAEDFEYAASGGEVTIVGYNGGSADVVIPQTIDGMPVTTIGSSAFEGKSEIRTAVLPRTITRIEVGAFNGCENLTAVYGTENVRHYGSMAFYGCSQLSKIAVSSNVAELEWSAFSECPLLEIVLSLPEDSPLIDASGYGDAITLCFFELKNGAATLVRAMHGSSDAWDVHVPGTYRGYPVTTIGFGAFTRSRTVRSVSLPDGVKTIEKNAFGGTELQTIDLPASLTSIGEEAFIGCRKLTAVVLPDGLTHLGESAFWESGLTSVNIPAGITEIPHGCFGLSNLETFVIPDHITVIGGCALTGNPIKSIVIPDSVTELCAYLCDGMTELVDVTLPSGIKELPMCAFSGCTSLESIVLPDSIERIGLAAFSGCTSLTSVNIPANIWHIPSCAFRGSGIQNQAVKRVVAEAVKPGMSDFEKALALHDWLIYNARYDTDYVFYGAEGVLIYGRGVCQSYMEAYMQLLDAVGIANYAVYGNAGGTSHTWNLVKLDGEWYHIDPTWDDPLPNGNESHQYFGLTDEMISKDHFNWKDASLPAANGTRYRYGRDNGAK